MYSRLAALRGACVMCAMMSAAIGAAASRSADTTRYSHADSLLFQADTAKTPPKAPLRRYEPLAVLGSIDTGGAITPRTLIYSAVAETYDALRRRQGLYPLDLASPGQNSDALINGLDMRNTAVMLDGRPLNNPLTGRFSFLHAAPDFPERIEIVDAPRAAVYGFNATAAAINFVPEIFNTNRAYARVRYNQTAFNYIASDIAASQNVSRPLNLSIGIDRESQLGEFINTGLEYWNVRGALRWFADSSFNVLLSENFTHNHAGVNGGVYPQDIDANNLLANVNLPAANDEDFRHDLTLTAAFGRDSGANTFTDCSLYFSSLIANYISQQDPFSPPLQFPFTTANQSNAMRWFGADARTTTRFGGFELSAGAALQEQIIAADTTMPAARQTLAGAYAIAEQSLGGIATVSLFGRADEIGAFFRPTIGADARLGLAPGLSVTAGAARTDRTPTPQELWWHGPALRGNESLSNERHTIVSAGIRYDSRPVSFNVTASSRTIADAIEAQLQGDSLYTLVQTETERIAMLSASLAVAVGYFSIEGTGEITIMREGGAQLRRAPVLYGSGGVYYHNPRVLGVPLDLKAGLEGRIASPFTGELYLPSAQYFAGDAAYSSGVNGSADATLALHIGNAYVRLGMTNLTDTRFYYTPYYPITDRSFFVGFTWALFD